MGSSLEGHGLLGPSAMHGLQETALEFNEFWPPLALQKHGRTTCRCITLGDRARVFLYHSAPRSLARR